MSQDRAPCRVSHSRFRKNKPLYKYRDLLSETDKIVTVAWNLDDETGILTYGATVYKRVNNDRWVKKLHRERAIERFNTCPLRFNVKNFPVPLNRYAMDWYIGRVLTAQYGCYYKGKDNSTDRFDADICINPFTFEMKYDPVGHEVRLNDERRQLFEKDMDRLFQLQKQQQNKACHNIISLLLVSLSLGVMFVMT